MLKERDTSLCTAYPTRIPSYFFNSFFVHQLMIRDEGYQYSNNNRNNRNNTNGNNKNNHRNNYYRVPYPE